MASCDIICLVVKTPGCSLGWWCYESRNSLQNDKLTAWSPGHLQGMKWCMFLASVTCLLLILRFFLLLLLYIISVIIIVYVIIVSSLRSIYYVKLQYHHYRYQHRFCFCHCFLMKWYSHCYCWFLYRCHCLLYLRSCGIHIIHCL